MPKLSYAAAVVVLVATSGTAMARDQIRIVGSSTVFPFATAVAEQFGRKSGFPTPVVESTGSGGGIKLFCGGVGADFPDIANSSRRMKASEFELCQAAGVTDITEAIIGYDGIVVANDQSGPDFSLTREQITLALASNGPLPTTWNEVDPSLPAIRIEVLGPPPSSGTRDAFEELVLHEGCAGAGLDCATIGVRDDGAFIEAGENDNLIVSKLEANPNALGVFGFSFLDQNSDAIKGAEIDGVEPEFDNIADGLYPVSRPLFIYVKNAHVDAIPGIREYLAEFFSEAASGEDGYLVDKGLIPLPEDMFEEVSESVLALTPMTGEELH